MPTLRDSSSASSLRFATIASASACRRRARSFGGRLAPRAVERLAGGVDRAVDVGLAGHRGARERIAGRRLREVADLARRRLDDLAADEEAVLLSRGRAIAVGT